MQARWNGQVVAESDDTVVVEGNHYFPLSSLDKDFVVNSNTTSKCSWKGTASYYNVVVDGKENTDAAFYYSEPKSAAKNIKNRVAFWRGIEVTD